MLTKRDTLKNPVISDDSDDEEVELKTGNVPLKWYENESHLGYSLKGDKIKKRMETSQIDNLLSSESNPDFWRTVYDELNQKTVKLTTEQIRLLKRIKNKAYIDDTIKNTDYNYEVPVDPRPMKDTPVIKRRFMPSMHERKKINKIVFAMKMGWFKPPPPLPTKPTIEDFINDVSDVWGGSKNDLSRKLAALPPPKLSLPTHEHSFNPPMEYQEDPKPAPKNLRGLENNNELLKDNFERLMSLYLAPRVKKKKIHMRPEDLVEELPNLEELKPYPTKAAYQIDTSSSFIKSISMSHNDNFLAVVDDFKTLYVYHTLTTRLVFKTKLDTEGIISCKFTASGLLMVTCEESINFYALKLNFTQYKQCVKYFDEIYQTHKDDKNENEKVSFSFPFFSQEPKERSSYLAHLMKAEFLVNKVASSSLHVKEQYVCIVTKKADDTRQLDVINIPRCKHTKISIKAKSKIQKTLFHRTKPFLFIMTVGHIFVYDLQKQQIKKKLISGCRYLSDMQLHSSGDHLLVSSYDRQVLWFDVDSNEYPFKKMKIHNLAVRAVGLSEHYKLASSCSDDGKIVVQHVKIDTEGFAFPVIIPLKALFGHKKSPQGLNILGSTFFNSKYWLASCGADGKVIVWA